MSMNSVLESLSETNDEQIKRLAAFFADMSYQFQNIDKKIQYQSAEWIVIECAHKESGFDGAIYYCEATSQLVVAFRGTEFTADERGYRDAIKNDVLGFGYNKEPLQYADALELARVALNGINEGKITDSFGNVHLLNVDTKLIITGHSLGGGLAQLVGAQSDFKDVEVHTFNAIGVAQMVDNLSKEGFNFSGDYSNITNHVISRDFVSTIYDHLGEVIVYKPSLENRLTAGDYIPFNFSKKGNGIIGTIYPALGKAFKGHTITNFTGSILSIWKVVILPIIRCAKY